ncbi:sulfatase-like hydrolase/transferase [bacterium]|nr:sulfatase-like hydrolase/transferase [candidate division CSSED10-310 bacterium]
MASSPATSFKWHHAWMRTIGLLFLLAASLSFADYLRIRPRMDTIVSRLDFIGFAALETAISSINQSSVTMFSHSVFIHSEKQYGDIAWSILSAWTQLLFIAALLTRLIIPIVRPSLRIAGISSLSVIIGALLGCSGFIAGLLTDAFLFQTTDHWFWIPGSILGSLIGAYLAFPPVTPSPGLQVFIKPLDRARRWMLILILTLLTGYWIERSLLNFESFAFKTDPQSPSVLLIILDTLREDGLGICGNPGAYSPEIDRFFQHQYQITGLRSDSSWTAPSFASLFTGLCPSLHGISRVFHTFPPGIETLAEVFQANGTFTCALFCNPVLQGDMGYRNGFDIYINRIDHREAIDTEQSAVALIPFLKRQNSHFLAVQFMDCHNPYTPSLRYDLQPFDRFSNAVISWPIITENDKNPQINANTSEIRKLHIYYQGGLRDADRSIGVIFREWARAGLLDNTLIIITSDHGEEFREHGSLDHCATLYEETVRIPFLFRPPAATAPVSHSFVLPERKLLVRHGLLSDLGTTLFSLMGLPQQLGHGIDLLSPAVKNRPLMLETNRLGFPIRAVVRNQMKYIAPLEPAREAPLLDLYYPRPWKDPELYDLSVDLQEQVPVTLDPETETGLVTLWKQVDPSQTSSIVREMEINEATENALRELGYIR